MGKFRKKPVVIEAVQLTWDNWDEMCVFANVGSMLDQPHGTFINDDNLTMGLLIPTLGGEMLAHQNDWVIKGVKGELYPCKPDIFEATYEAIDES